MTKLINLNFLIGTQEIDSIEIINDCYKYTIVFYFKWEIDFGCFSCNKISTLTVIIPKKLIMSVILDLKENKGIVYDYIKKHRRYTGELLDLRSEKIGN